MTGEADYSPTMEHTDETEGAVSIVPAANEPKQEIEIPKVSPAVETGTVRYKAPDNQVGEIEYEVVEVRQTPTGPVYRVKSGEATTTMTDRQFQAFREGSEGGNVPFIPITFLEQGVPQRQAEVNEDSIYERTRRLLKFFDALDGASDILEASRTSAPTVSLHQEMRKTIQKVVDDHTPKQALEIRIDQAEKERLLAEIKDEEFEALAQQARRIREERAKELEETKSQEQSKNIDVVRREETGTNKIQETKETSPIDEEKLNAFNDKLAEINIILEKESNKRAKEELMVQLEAFKDQVDKVIAGENPPRFVVDRKQVMNQLSQIDIEGLKTRLGKMKSEAEEINRKFDKEKEDLLKRLRRSGKSEEEIEVELKRIQKEKDAAIIERNTRTTQRLIEERKRKAAGSGVLGRLGGSIRALLR